MIEDCRPLGTKLKELIDDIFEFMKRKGMGSDAYHSIVEHRSWYGEVNEMFVKRLKKIIKEEIKNEKNNQ